MYNIHLKGAKEALSPSRIALVRIVLQPRLIVECGAHRTGVAANITCAELSAMVPAGEKHLIRVRQHKTMAARGSAKLFVDSQMRLYLEVWRDSIRPYIMHGRDEAVAEDKLFVKNDGAKVTSSDLSKAIQRHWKSQGYGEHVNGAVLRKSVVTLVSNCFIYSFIFCIFLFINENIYN